MTSSAESTDVIVVGAGLSGLLAAGNLHRRGLGVRVLEKARGVGGRLATRREEHHTADHGAQFFTAHDPRFRALVESWVQAGVARQWSTGFTAPDGGFRDNGVPRYCGAPTMTAIPKHLAHGLDVRLRSRVAKVEIASGTWRLVTESGETHSARGLLLTAPIPQSLALLETGRIPLPEAVRSDLEQVDYAPCLTLLAELAGPSRVPEPGGVWMSGDPLFWITDNLKKGVSKAATPVVTIHAGQDFSQEHWDSPEADVTLAILAAAEPWLGSAVKGTQLHRWRYAVPLRAHPESCVTLAEPAPLAFAGDAFGGPRVEAAALSGLAAAEALASRLA